MQRKACAAPKCVHGKVDEFELIRRYFARQGGAPGVIVGVDPDPANADMLRDWAVGYYDAVHPHSSGGAYINFMMEEGQERVQASYRGNYDRLAEIKAKYDPNNLFKVNQNIHPKG